jgi:hypothetical protein
MNQGITFGLTECFEIDGLTSHTHHRILLAGVIHNLTHVSEYMHTM